MTETKAMSRLIPPQADKQIQLALNTLFTIDFIPLIIPINGIIAEYATLQCTLF